MLCGMALPQGFVRRFDASPEVRAGGGKGGGKGGIAQGEDLCGQPGGVARAGLVQRHGGHREAGRHLHRGEQGVHAAERRGRHRNADHGLCRARGHRSRTVGGHALYGEGETALAAAGAAYGIVAQAGTGSDAFLVQPGGQMSIGGWGYIFGDEGSGYDIGERTLRAAIHAFDGRGPKTLWTS